MRRNTLVKEFTRYQRKSGLGYRMRLLGLYGHLYQYPPTCKLGRRVLYAISRRSYQDLATRDAVRQVRHVDEGSRLRTIQHPNDGANASRPFDCRGKNANPAFHWELDCA